MCRKDARVSRVLKTLAQKSSWVSPTLDGREKGKGKVFSEGKVSTRKEWQDFGSFNTQGFLEVVIGPKSMNNRAEDAARKIILLFEWGGICPLEPDKFAKVSEHIRSILGRAMETEKEHKARRWANYNRVMSEKRKAEE